MDKLRAEVVSRERLPEAIHQKLVSRFGDDRALLAIGEHFRITGEPARAIAFPKNVDELRDMLAFATSEKLTVIPAGAGTWLNMGNPPVRAHLIVSTVKMNRVVEYEPADLTATVEAGCTLAGFNDQARDHKQWIPLEPFGDPSATIGATVATASSGPLRCGFGTPRDWVIGMQVVHAYGLTTRAGGKVVKNVAGYDLCKLYTGSYGTLGIITEISFKMRALPTEEQTVIFTAGSLSDICDLALRFSASDVNPSAMELLSVAIVNDRIALATTSEGNYALALRFLGDPETIEWQVKEAKTIAGDFRSFVPDAGEVEKFWQDFRETEISQEWDIILRVSVKPADVWPMIQEIQTFFPESPMTMLRVHASNGVIRIHASDQALEWFRSKERPKRLGELRTKAQARGGNMVILRAPLELKAHLDVWGEIGLTANIMHALKQKFDPQSLLNPGRFVAGI